MKRLLFCMTIAALLVGSSEPTTTATQAHKPKGRALLVGINRYAQPYVNPTPGSEEDAFETRDFIKQKYGFEESEIRVLTGPQATAANIVAEFKHWLIEGTEPGDRVFFLYSGHGSRIPDRNGDEEDGYDEIIAPYDVAARDKQFFNVVSDDEIGKLIAQLSGRMTVMVFDSCHSGTISRNIGASSSQKSEARYLPDAETLAELQTQKTRGGGSTDYVVLDDKKATRDFKMVDEKTVGPATGIVVFSAAQAGQVAYPIRVNGGVRGALSYLFNETQRGREPSLQQMAQELTANMAALQRAGKMSGNQIPAFEVFSTIPLADQPLFATPLSVPAVALANPQSTVKLSIDTLENKRRYRFGETVSYQVKTDTPGYLYLLVFSEGDVATCVFPNKNISKNRLEIGSHIITNDGREGFYVGEPAGKDVVVALLSATELNLGGQRQDYNWSDVFSILKTRRFTEYIRTRGQTVQKPAELTNWQAASLVLEAIDKPR
ncbi:MAG: caspase family protein [Acidobacteriota bacterium]|nr:caspase family protein [Acidobacteriota bacterium]